MNFGTLVVAIVVTIVGFLGLFAAAHAVDEGFQLFGYVMMAFAILLNFWFLKRHFDRADQAMQAAGH